METQRAIFPVAAGTLLEMRSSAIGSIKAVLAMRKSWREAGNILGDWRIDLQSANKKNPPQGCLADREPPAKC
jgi:hypothetical protein